MLIMIYINTNLQNKEERYSRRPRLLETRYLVQTSYIYSFRDLSVHTDRGTWLVRFGQ